MNTPSAATKLSIERRIELRKAVAGAWLRKSLVVLTPDELDALLDRYEHGGFSTREPAFTPDGWLANTEEIVAARKVLLDGKP